MPGRRIDCACATHCGHAGYDKHWKFGASIHARPILLRNATRGCVAADRAALMPTGCVILTPSVFYCRDGRRPIIQVRRVVSMKRVVLLLACSGALSGCGSFNWSMPTMDMGSSFSGAPGTVNVRVDSQPQGAEARGSNGGGCRTPCSLPLPANGTSTVNFALQGYLPAALPVSIRTTRETLENGESGAMGDQVVIDPNPVFAVLDPAPPPPPPKRARPKQPPKPKQQPVAAPAPQFGPAPPPPGFR